MYAFIRKPCLRRLWALVLALCLCLSPLGTIAETYYIEDGNIEVKAEDGKQTVTQGETTHTETEETVIKNNDPNTASKNTVTIEAKEGATAEVTIQDLNINTRNDPRYDYIPGNGAALAVSGAGSVTIELDGSSSLTGSKNSAGLEKAPGSGSLTIGDGNETPGALTANGGYNGAGIGGRFSGTPNTVSGIAITGGEVTANGGDYGAGIGGGCNSNGENISISGGTVTATGGYNGAGIGGGENDIVSVGYCGNGAHISITGGTVTAVGGYSAAGIGGGYGGTGSDVTVSGSAQVSAAGGGKDHVDGAGAAIGNGGSHDLSQTPVDGAETTPKTNGLACGSLTYYDQGTTAAAINNGTAKPSENYDPNPIGTGHKAGEPVEENRVEPSCTQAGSYDLVTYCTVCKGEISRETKTIPASHDLVHHDAQAATCTEVGWEAYDTCKNCDYTTYKEIPAQGHDKVHHDAQAATCTEVGWEAYDTCSRCEYTTYKEIPVDPDAHEPAEPVKENEVAARVDVAGSYDLVTYCALCGQELSRETVKTAALENPFARFCETLAQRIRKAPEKGTVEANAKSWTGLQRDVFKALQERPDVTLKLTCRLNGEVTELIIPAGADLLSAMGDARSLTFEQIAQLLG